MDIHRRPILVGNPLQRFPFGHVCFMFSHLPHIIHKTADNVVLPCEGRCRNETKHSGIDSYYRHQRTRLQAEVEYTLPWLVLKGIKTSGRIGNGDI